MPHLIKQPHKLGFFTGTAGLTDLTAGTFTVDGISVSSTVLSSLSFHDLGGGFYYAQYTPDVTGEYILTITSSSVSTFGAIEAVDVEDESVVLLTQDTSGVGALKPTLPTVYNKSTITELNEYLLLVISSSDWDVGRKTPNYSHAITGIDNDGNWITTPLTVVPGTYHIVIRNNFGVERVVKAYLEV